MSELVGVGARTHLWALLNKTLDELIALPDEDAAPALQGRMSAWDQVDILHERSYSERGMIALEFEKRKLWQYVINPASGNPFTSFSAWATHGPLGGRRVTFEAKKDIKALEDVPAGELREIPKCNIQTLKGLSTKVRNEPAVLDAAKKLSEDEFLEKLDKEYPDQHTGGKRQWLRFRLKRHEREEIEEALKLAMEDGATSKSEALFAIAIAYKVNRILEEREREQVQAQQESGEVQTGAEVQAAHS